MTQLHEATLCLPAAALGGENPLPALRPLKSVIDSLVVDDSVPREDRRHVGYGLDAVSLPYGIQSRYDRNRQPRVFRTFVLENELLRAVFLPELGGRLWSLFDKASGRELLYVNSVFQPANLAIRNAWFSGGVEWNMSIRGHSPFTCSPLFGARLSDPEGSPVLRLYEWERVRGVPFQLDFHLPPGSPFLLVHTRILNPHDAVIPMYWWSNVAVPEAPGHRVLAPADSALAFGYRAKHLHMRSIRLPDGEGVDVSYPTRAACTADFFFRIPDGRRPWMASLDPSGFGLLQVSTAHLRGRKCFVWGLHQGGRRWQDWLSGGGEPYLEIQAGLARTQMECVPMPAGATWAWLEAYGAVRTDPAQAHGGWRDACDAVQGRVDKALPETVLAERLEWTARVAERPPDELLSLGSGWGALERRRRKRAGERPMGSSALRFDDASLGADQQPWLELLDQGGLPEADPGRPPSGWMTQEAWRRLLETSVRQGRSAHWFGWLHLGVMRYAARDPAGARLAWETSVTLSPSAWAARNLAVLDADEGKLDAAADRLVTACSLAPGIPELAAECGQALLCAGRGGEFTGLADGLAPAVRQVPRIQVLLARAALTAGDSGPAEALLTGRTEVPDIREGEISLTDLWFDVRAQRHADPNREEPPSDIDFRMS